MVLPCTESLLNRTNYGFGIHPYNQKIQRLNDLIYMDDIKLYAATNSQLKELLRLTETFQETLKCYLGFKNAKL